MKADQFQVRKREQLYEKRKLKQYLSWALGKNQLQGPLSYVNITGEDGRSQRLSSAKEVAQILVGHMVEWMGCGREGWYMEWKVRDLWDLEKGRLDRFKIAEGQLNPYEFYIPKNYHVVLGHLKELQGGSFSKMLSFPELLLCTY